VSEKASVVERVDVKRGRRRRRVDDGLTESIESNRIESTAEGCFEEARLARSGRSGTHGWMDFTRRDDDDDDDDVDWIWIFDTFPSILRLISFDYGMTT